MTTTTTYTSSSPSAWIAVLDIHGLTAAEYDAVVARMGVEREPAPGIYLHLATPLEGGAGIRVIEMWDDPAGFQSFIETRMLPAAQALGLARETKVSVTPLHNVFAPRAAEIAAAPAVRRR